MDRKKRLRKSKISIQQKNVITNQLAVYKNLLKDEKEKLTQNELEITSLLEQYEEYKFEKYKINKDKNIAELNYKEQLKQQEELEELKLSKRLKQEGK
eukprot:Pgem_evm1s9995